MLTTLLNPDGEAVRPDEIRVVKSLSAVVTGTPQSWVTKIHREDFLPDDQTASRMVRWRVRLSATGSCWAAINSNAYLKMETGPSDSGPWALVGNYGVVDGEADVEESVSFFRDPYIRATLVTKQSPIVNNMTVEMQLGW